MSFRFARGFARRFSFTAKTIGVVAPTVALSSLFLAQSNPFVAFAAPASDDDGATSAFDADKVLLDNMVLPPRGRPSNPDTLVGLVKDLGLSDIDKYLMDPTKDVLVEFYSPGCTACLNFAISLENVAEALKDHPDIVIAKINAFENFRPGILSADQEGVFPTVLLFPADDRKQRLLAANESFITQLKQYNEALTLERHNERNRRREETKGTGKPYEELPTLTVEDLKLRREMMPCAGVELPMTTGGRDEVRSWDLMLEFLHNNGKHKFDLEKAKAFVDARAADIRKRARATLPPPPAGLDVAMHSPCADKFADFWTTISLKGVGTASVNDIRETRSAYQQCLLDKKKEEIAFWTEVKSNYDVVASVLKDEIAKGKAAQ